MRRWGWPRWPSCSGTVHCCRLNASIQHTAELGGVGSTKHACWEYQACMLKLQVYAGATFAMVEDDGVYTVCAHSQFNVPS